MSGENWETLEAQTAYATPYLQVAEELVATPSRPQGVKWTVVRRPTAAVVAPRTAKGGYLLIRQERISVQRVLWEFPAGQVDGEVSPETILHTAHRELGEETGTVCSGEMIALGYYYSSAGFTTERAHLFLASEVTARDEGSEHDEHEAILEVREFTVEELREMIGREEIVDANTLAMYARLQTKGLL